MNLKKIKKIAFVLILLLSIILVAIPKTSTGYSEINGYTLDQIGLGGTINIYPMDKTENSKNGNKHSILHEDNWYCAQPLVSLSSYKSEYKISSIYNIENNEIAYIVNQKCTLYGTGNSGIRKDTQVAYWNALDSKYTNEYLKQNMDAYINSVQKTALDKSFSSGAKIYEDAKKWVNNIKSVNEVEILTNTQVENATITLNNFTSNDILGIYDKVYVDNIEKTSVVKDGKLTITRPSTRK